MRLGVAGMGVLRFREGGGATRLERCLQTSERPVLFFFFQLYVLHRRFITLTLTTSFSLSLSLSLFT